MDLKLEGDALMKLSRDWSAKVATTPLDDWIDFWAEGRKQYHDAAWSPASSWQSCDSAVCRDSSKTPLDSRFAGSRKACAWRSQVTWRT